MLFCKFCNKESKNTNSQRNHERLCKDNPDRKYTNGMTGKSAWNKGLDKSDPRVTKYGLASSKKLKGHTRTIHTNESKANLSKKAKANGLGGHTSKLKLYFRKNDGTEVYLQSSYEIKFAQILEELNIIWERPAPLPWIDDNGIDHKYYPDFKVGDKYFDTKNDYLAKIDARKIELVILQNSVDLKIVSLNQINKEYIAPLAE